MYLVTEKCPSPTLLLPRSLVLAAVLVVVTGARVALAPSHGDADRRPNDPVHGLALVHTMVKSRWWGDH